ncbi:Sau3AI family type II restriction endonuclease [Ectobacillus sp. sgz5001026]|uniref:Sau3AI family type II restriction endonuclease n=1 Tax=Ectobacillus sp. sgz5001026 TaxID=3242473 RepID=UPI0036D39826
MDYQTMEELLIKAKEAEGKSFKELDKYNRLENIKAKGALGQVIEESFFGYSINSAARPDFDNIGVELKVTPFKKNKNKSLSAKERLVLNIINYMEEAYTTFYSSSFWKKNKCLLLMFYEWKPDVNRQNFYIQKSILYQYPEADLEIIKQDWKTIIDKIRSGKADELSEGDTNYLGACTKGSNKSSLRPQPFSQTMAMQRAFSLKQSYMTSLVRKFVDQEELVSFAKTEELKTKTLDQLLYERFSPFVNLTDKEIATKTGIEYKNQSKSFVANIISSLLGIKGTNLNQIAEFAKANIKFKTIRLEPNGKPQESMSFKNIDFHQWTSESWEDSYIRNFFLETKFLFVIFKYKETKKQNFNRELFFEGIKLWNMPFSTIEKELKQVWEEVNKLITEGLKISYIKKGQKKIETNNLPKSSFNGVAHIRPKGRDGTDKIQLPNEQTITKQCFWLNSSYVAQIVNED